jgi:hypothetical protein
VTLAELHKLESIPAPVFAWLCENGELTPGAKKEIAE